MWGSPENTDWLCLFCKLNNIFDHPRIIKVFSPRMETYKQ